MDTNDMPDTTQVSDESTTEGESIHDYVPQEEEATQESPETSEEVNEDQAEEQSSTFTEKFSPDKLPDDLKPVYKQMQADYTRKTQELAEMRRTFDERMRQVEDYLANMQGEPQEPEQVSEEEYPQDPKEYADWVAQKAIAQMTQILQAKEQEEALRREEEAFEKEVAEAQKLDERLEKDEVFAGAIAGIVAADVDYSEGRKSLVDATRDAIKLYEEQVRANIEKAKAELSQKAMENRKPDLASQTNTVSKDKKIESIWDAVPEGVKLD